MASLSNYAEDATLDHLFGDGTLTITAPLYLALCTTVPTDSSTGSTIVEASYTGYARKAVAAADMSASSGGSKTNSNALIFADCTASSSTVIGWALCTASTAGNVIFWGTCTSTVISTTQTPATVAIGALVCTLD